MNRQDKDLPFQRFDLDRFLRKAAGIKADYGNDEATETHPDVLNARWMEFAIAGLNTEGGYRAQIDLSQHVISLAWLEEMQYKVKRRYDFDSLLGRSDNLPYMVDIEIFPLFGSGFKLQKSLHIGSITIQDGSQSKSVEDFQVPHVVLGHAGKQRSSIRLMLPALVDFSDLGNREVPKEVVAALYDSCLYPAAKQAIHRGEAGHWPPSRQAEILRARRRNGTLQNSGRLVPQKSVLQFGNELLKNIKRHHWGKGAYFFHELRGTRGATQHTWSNREESLDKYLSIINRDLIDERTWWVDLGLEIQCPGQVLWWRMASHQQILSRILQINNLSVLRLLENKRAAQVDKPCQLEDIAGLRVRVPQRHRDVTGIAYIQAYNTEKEAIYQVSEQGNALSLSYSDVLLKKNYKIQQYASRIAEIWGECRDQSDGHARLELRVNLAKLDQSVPYFHVTRQDLMDLFCQFDCQTWWDFKTVRLTAMCQAIRWWAECSEGRGNPLSISLVIGLTYMINCLNSRPVELPAEKQIHHQLLKDILIPRMETDIDGEEVITGYDNPLGVAFPSSLIIDPALVDVPQLGEDMQMPLDVLSRLFNGQDMLSLQVALTAAEIHVRAPTARVLGTRIPNAIHRRNTRFTGAIAQQDQIEVAPDVGLGALPGNDHGGQEDNAEAASAFSRLITELVARSYMDLLLCSPNVKGQNGESYCSLNERGRKTASAATFQEPNLAKLWRRCIVKPGDDDSWEQAFAYLFPCNVVHKAKGSWQNYDNCPFFTKWRDVMALADEPSKLELQSLVREKWSRLAWMPWPRSDRIWVVTSTKTNKITQRNECITYPIGYEGVAPVIITNPNWQGEAVHFEPIDEWYG